MTIDEIKNLIEQVDKSALTEFVYEKDGEKLVLSKKQKPAPQPVAVMPQMGMMPAPMGAYGGAMPQAMPAGAVPASDAADSGAAKDDSVAEIRSPYIRTILLKADDSAVSLVNVGDHIKKGQKLCEIEAMKMYSDVTSTVDGTVLSIEVDHGDIVECDQLLFRIQKG